MQIKWRMGKTSGSSLIRVSETADISISEKIQRRSSHLMMMESKIRNITVKLKPASESY